jgi:hypothetical protein
LFVHELWLPDMPSIVWKPPPAMSLSNSLRFGGAIPQALSEKAMGFLSKLALMAE